EFILFEVSIHNIAADPSGFGVWYEPGGGTPQKRFGVRIFTDAGVVGEYVPPRSRAKVLMSAGAALAYALLNKPAFERERHYQ
ncbi:MAG TPA: mandelate racemase/muconate lactonizing protein, partial [Deltaproteobacteria bacterium]|nr:mandelate racemase/muconate lactonizing protein [Deltaproteobacteria bacterium]